MSEHEIVPAFVRSRAPEIRWPPQPWVVLYRVPRRANTENFPPGKDITLLLAKPPLSSIATVPWRIAPDDISPTNYPYIVAADASGFLLLYATQGRSKEPADTTLCDARMDLVPAYFLCHAHRSSASLLPKPPSGMVFFHFHNVGLIANPRADGHFLVAELQHLMGTHHASLLCYSTSTDSWFAREFAYHPNHPKRPYDGVISHKRKLWWVDLAYGLFTCDPFTEQPELLYISLPLGCVQPSARSQDIAKRRCVNLSHGKLRYVQIDDCPGKEKVTMWTLHNAVHWRLEYEASFTEIWADASYKASRLQCKVPALAFVHPSNPKVVYFFQDYLIFCANISSRMVMDGEFISMTCPPIGGYSSSSVLAWELPASLQPNDKPFLGGPSYTEGVDHRSAKRTIDALERRLSAHASGLWH
ncbi:uncharacterized protein LOC124648225 [Lolium rigidum]|uniref:uncharacterized protein LOC124648225 n=1 Tax=Lolium rigidum TaxID=89674 RepID=UPI001F5DE998|nr:uncharacterized protein LOC124648225 [Lolium rigidum]